MDLSEILVKYFGSTFKFEESPSCESYGKLTDLLYDVAKLTGIDVENIIETLDDISSENALRDENGNVISDDEAIEKQLKELEAHECLKNIEKQL